MRRQHAAWLALAAGAALIAPLATSAAAAPTAPTPAPTPILKVGKAAEALKTKRGKIDVLGIWAHPDDDAGFITPCGVWHDKYGVTCGIIMATRGEGGSNSVGPEAGPDLGLRRENEDRASHVRSGTFDIFNLDRVDFFYNTSAPLTGQIWDAEETLRRTVRIIREVQPEILVGSSPSLSAGHGNHQYAQGRMVWEASEAAADPTRFPEQLRGTGAVKTWQVKKILAGGMTTGTGGVSAANCTTGFTPAADNPFTVAGVWTGYDSPYTWAAGNTAGIAAGTGKTWAQAGREGYMAHATQARTKLTGAYNPTCTRYGVSSSRVPMQPNSAAAAGNDDAVLYGATKADPGGFPLGSLFHVDAPSYFAGAGVPFPVKVTARAGKGLIGPGKVSLGVPSGWTVSAPQSVLAITPLKSTELTFTVTPAAGAAVGRYQITAAYSGRIGAKAVTAYNDTRVELTAPVEGRFQRWGNFAEYEQWAADHDAWVGGRSAAVGQIGAGESITVPVVVTNRTTTAQSGTVALSAPAGFALDAASKPFPSLAGGASTTVNFVLTSTDPADAGGRQVTIGITTTSGAGTSSENLTMYLVPTAVIPKLATAPTVGADFPGTVLDTSRLWEGSACNPAGVDCGAGSTATVGWYGDDLYLRVKVIDDKVSAAATPDRCFGHWLEDSVEVLLDPRGASLDTSTTFKLGVFPFTDDPTGANGNGVDGPCWERDADNHQGFATGPLAATVKNAPNAPGVVVKANAPRAGGAYTDGYYTVDVKIPLADLPAAVGPTSPAPTGAQATNSLDPSYLGLNVTPYDSDRLDFIGETRLAWSPFGSQQSEPYRWGHAYLADYTPPAGRATVAPKPILPDTALQGVASPQTIFQSATRGGTISGVQPSQGLKVQAVVLTRKAVTMSVLAAVPGTIRAYLWQGDPKAVQVWNSSCVGGDPYGFDTCALPKDITAAPWAPDMGGHVLGSKTVAVPLGRSTVSIPIDSATYGKLASDSQLLVSWAQRGISTSRAGDGVDAWAFPIETFSNRK